MKPKRKETGPYRVRETDTKLWGIIRDGENTFEVTFARKEDAERACDDMNEREP